MAPGLLTRVANRLLGRSYDGAAGGRRWRGFRGMPDLRAAQMAARGPMATRARALVANNALAASGAEAWTSALVGSGIKPQSAHPDPAIRAALNAAFERWTDEADADGLTDFYALQALAARRLVVDGESFGAFMLDGRGALRVRLLDAEQVDASLTSYSAAGARIVAGVEFDAAGRRTAYHIRRERPGMPLASPLQTVRVGADDAFHLLRPEVAGQVRGVSWFAPVLLRLADYDSAADAQLTRQKIGALLTGFVTSTDGEVPFDGEEAGPGMLEGGLEPGTLKVLAPGQDVSFSDPAEIGQEAIEFMKVTAREIAAGLGIPYEQLTGDLSGVNYSSIRAGLVDFRRRVEALQYGVLVFQMCRPTWRRFVTAEVLAGRLSAPGFFTDPAPYLAAKWITPKREWVDPKKDVEAEISAIGAGLMSRREAVAARGTDIEALDAEIASDKARAEGLGLTFTAGLAPTIEVPANVD
ncbi:phage portal protein [Ancylobacter dichloromethanicus]|uniref:Phage portal protein n=1 Tax=Ancylobacter dichloromethanicus TaxID=518825 RepID=A0A9W6J7J4_9HYPH|nr:phage portal protein [Ancylobacter dichloromethanicus]GLK71286.1 phage portal protein [Ancylobacter dichloromethanicus]